MNKKTYKLRLEVKTPLFIGNGVKYSRISYINDFENRKIFILDEAKWIDFLTKRKATDIFIDYIQRKGKFTDIKQFLTENNRIFKIQNLSSIFPSISTHTLSTRHLDKMNNNDIEAFIKSMNGLPYIPGSSIKGAINNAVFKKIIGNNYKDSEKIANYIDSYAKTRRMDFDSKRIIKEAMDYKRIINDKSKEFKGMSGIQISDSSFFALENLKIYRKFDISPKNPDERDPGEKVSQRSAIPLFRECAEVGTKVDFTIGIDSMKLKPEYGIKNINDLLEIINDSFETLYGGKGVISEYRLINQFLPESAKEGVLIQLGGGAGFHSKTAISGLALPSKEKNNLTAKVLSVKFRNHKHDKGVRVISPRCLKVVNVKNKKMLMGICQLSKVQE